MDLGITKFLRRLNVIFNIIKFCILSKLLGFENANAFLRRIDKNSLIPILKRNGATIGDNCDIESPLIFHNCADFSNLIIHNNCHIGKNCFFDLRGKVIIEDNVVISMQTTFITHQDLNRSELKSIYPATADDIIIKSNCYVGANVTILKGVIINESAVIAAGSVINKNVGSYSVVGGVPAKFIKKINP